MDARRRASDGVDVVDVLDASARADEDEGERKWSMSEETTRAEAALVGACRVCLEDISRDEIRRGVAYALGCDCTGGFIHAASECAGAYALTKASEVDSTTCELCLGEMRDLPSRAAVLSRRRLEDERARRDVTVDIMDVDTLVGERSNGTSSMERSSARARVGSVAAELACAPCALLRGLLAVACSNRAVILSFGFFSAGIFVLLNPDRLT